MIQRYCPDCYGELEEIELNTFLCLCCGEEWDIDELRETDEDPLFDEEVEKELTW